MTRHGNIDKSSFAYVYDAVYGGDTPFLEAQLSLLQAVFGPPPRPLLDVGCGTGTHVAGLSRLGYTVVGVDVDPLMLGMAERKVPPASLVRADGRRLPFGCGGGAPFQGALCLESPLAYFMTGEDLLTALRSIRTALKVEGRLVIDIYDYPGNLGTRPVGAHTAHFETDRIAVAVTESHRYEKQSQLWTMHQDFEVEEEGELTRFEVVHQLKIWSMEQYIDALNVAGFEVLEALTHYPRAPEISLYERRIILVARRTNSA